MVHIVVILIILIIMTAFHLILIFTMLIQMLTLVNTEAAFSQLFIQSELLTYISAEQFISSPKVIHTI